MHVLIQITDYNDTSTDRMRLIPNIDVSMFVEGEEAVVGERIPSDAQDGAF